jgi:hypothetical protein
MVFDLTINRSITDLPIYTKVRIRDVQAKTERDGIFSGGNIVD